MVSICLDDQGRINGICPDNLTPGSPWVQTDEEHLTAHTGSTVAEMFGHLCTERGALLYAAAADNAAELGAKAGDKLGMAIVTNMSKSTDATAEAEGVAQVYSTYAVVTMDEAGVITSCIIDASQANVKFDAKGQITNDITAPVQTKNELGANYGMVKASSIGKEWNEQAAAFAAYCVGKTPAEVQGVAMDNQGLAADADLLSSVTVHIGDFMNVVAKAAGNAK